jgi:hypothetical protein
LRRRLRSGSRAAAHRCNNYKDAESDFPGNELKAAYRKAGGEIALEYFEGDRHPGHSPDLTKTGDMFERMVRFVHEHVKA